MTTRFSVLLSSLAMIWVLVILPLKLMGVIDSMLWMMPAFWLIGVAFLLIIWTLP